MSDKYIIKNCPNLTTSYYGTGETIYNQCGITDDDLCANCTYCVLKRIVENLRQVAYAGHCGECDGCGYYNECSDTECGTYQALKSLELLDIEEVK